MFSLIMNPGLIFGIFLIICCYDITAQEITTTRVDDDYQHFREIYNQEFTNSDSSVIPNRITIHPASLADWLSNLPNSDENTIYTIGISDPGMMVDEAIELATLRAKIISALLLQPHISCIIDNYTTEGNGQSSDHFVTKYVNYYRMQSSLIGGPEQFQLINHFYTSFKEAVVLIKYEPSTPIIDVVDSVLLKIDVYQAERQQRNRFEFEEKCEVYGLSKQNNGAEEIDIFYYFYRSVNQFYEIVSRYNGVELDFPQSIFRYQGLASINLLSDVNEVSYKLTNGLWKAYLQSLIQSYTQTVVNPDVEISQVGDNYSSSSQNLSRELVIAAPAFRIKGIRVNNNRLSVLLNIDEVNQ